MPRGAVPGRAAVLRRFAPRFCAAAAWHKKARSASAAPPLRPAPAERRKRRGIVRFGKAGRPPCALARGDFSGWTDEKPPPLARSRAQTAVAAFSSVERPPRAQWSLPVSGASSPSVERPMCVGGPGIRAGRAAAVRPASIRRPARVASEKSTLFPLKKELVVFWHGLNDMPRKLAFCGASLVLRLHEIRSSAGYWPVCARLLERQGGEKRMACFLHDGRRRGNPSAPCVFLACRALS